MKAASSLGILRSAFGGVCADFDNSSYPVGQLNVILYRFVWYSQTMAVKKFPARSGGKLRFGFKRPFFFSKKFHFWIDGGG
ncbi:hypothetical protein [Novacetimonas maltaceti]|uniref:hypothetical protein n=1 Tax=Novacetimonas maltaceti TaxID=1203393 RepID=UPI0011B74DF7|nr:hypothetical protein [Novacetimonas maltaceti]